MPGSAAGSFGVVRFGAVMGTPVPEGVESLLAQRLVTVSFPGRACRQRPGVDLGLQISRGRPGVGTQRRGDALRLAQASSSQRPVSTLVTLKFASSFTVTPEPSALV